MFLHKRKCKYIGRQTYGRFMLNPEVIEEWPMGVDPDGIRVFDSAVPQLALGPGYTLT